MGNLRRLNLSTETPSWFEHGADVTGDGRTDWFTQSTSSMVPAAASGRVTVTDPLLDLNGAPWQEPAAYIALGPSSPTSSPRLLKFQDPVGLRARFEPLSDEQILAGSYDDQRVVLLPLGDLDGDGTIDFGGTLNLERLDSVQPLSESAGFIFYGGADLPDTLTPQATLEGVWSFTPLGDLDGDGRDEVLVSPTGFDAAHILPGRAARWSGGIDLDGVGVAITDQAGQRLHVTAERLGDLDGDGRQEIGVTCDGEEHYLYYGAADRLSRPLLLELRGSEGAGNAAEAVFESYHGTSYLMRGGDLNGDGRDDVLVGLELYAASELGTEELSGWLLRALIGSTERVVGRYFGSPTLPAGACQSPFGAYSRAVGDFDGDGYEDVGVGSVIGDGQFHIKFGGPEFGAVPERQAGSAPLR